MGGPGGPWPPDRALLRLKPSRRCESMGYSERYAMPHERGQRPAGAVTERGVRGQRPHSKKGEYIRGSGGGAPAEEMAPPTAPCSG